MYFTCMVDIILIFILLLYLIDIFCQEKEGPKAILTFHLLSHGRIVACHWPGSGLLPSLFPSHTK